MFLLKKFKKNERNEEKGSQLLKMLKNINLEVYMVYGNIGSPKANDSLVDIALEKYGMLRG
jgi:hypothetical protein